MGNCQAIDAATLVIQYPNGKANKLYWPIAASEIMKTNPGHYVTLLITTTAAATTPAADGSSNTVRLTRVKLLRPTDILALGHVYRLIDAEEVVKMMVEKKYGKMKKNAEKMAFRNGSVGGRFEMEKSNHQGPKREAHNQKTSSSTNPSTTRSRTWQPRLQSISEAGS